MWKVYLTRTGGRIRLPDDRWEMTNQPIGSFFFFKNRKAIETLLKRLHKANFVQRSFYARNIVVQPGPLWLPPAYRSLDEPSYRIIDFGRALGFGINCSSPDLMYTEAEEERYRALEKSLVPYY